MSRIYVLTLWVREGPGSAHQTWGKKVNVLCFVYLVHVAVLWSPRCAMFLSQSSSLHTLRSANQLSREE